MLICQQHNYIKIKKQKNATLKIETTQLQAPKNYKIKIALKNGVKTRTYNNALTTNRRYTIPNYN